jgi:hypothetical protein
MEFSFQQTAEMKIDKIVGRAARPLPLSFKGFRALSLQGLSYWRLKTTLLRMHYNIMYIVYV